MSWFHDIFCCGRTNDFYLLGWGGGGQRGREGGGKEGRGEGGGEGRGRWVLGGAGERERVHRVGWVDG